MSKHANRRRFLQLATAVGSALLSACVYGRDKADGAGCSGKRVVILGAVSPG
jgi:hypothetical protein